MTIAATTTAPTTAQPTAGGIHCPMPDCDAYLHLVRVSSWELYTDDLEVLPDREEPHGCTWRVECEDGHVVLVPAADPYDCDRGDGCGHDHSDEVRLFRRHDAARLRALLGAGVGR